MVVNLDLCSLNLEDIYTLLEIGLILVFCLLIFPFFFALVLPFL